MTPASAVFVDWVQTPLFVLKLNDKCSIQDDLKLSNLISIQRDSFFKSHLLKSALGI